MSQSYPQYQKRAVLKAASDIANGKVAVCLDVYDVLQAFGITNPAQAHAVKKILRAGNDHLSFEQDMQEVKDSLDRAVELEKSKGLGGEECPGTVPEPYVQYFSDGRTGIMGKLEGGRIFTRWMDSPRITGGWDPSNMAPISEAEARKLVEQAGGAW